MIIAPSILTANFLNLEEELNSISEAKLIHIDIMDGNFVPNISFGPSITKQISKATKSKLDVHLMVENPVDWIDKFAFENVEYITVHYESNNYEEALEKIGAKNIKKGISVNPQTPIEKIEKHLKDIDLVLVMSVNPGFGGQKFMPEVLNKVEYLKEYRNKYNLKYVIEIDGGININTYKDAKSSGVDIAVVGSYLFNQEDRNKEIQKLEK